MQAWFGALRAASRDWQESSPAPGASLRCGLLGEHLRHSYSPEIHAMLGAYSYDLFEVPPEGLADFLHGAAWDGLNVTIPYKRAVVPFCAALSPMAKQTGSVNTLVRRAARCTARTRTRAASACFWSGAAASHPAKRPLCSAPAEPRRRCRPCCGRRGPRSS